MVDQLYFGPSNLQSIIRSSHILLNDKHLKPYLFNLEKGHGNPKLKFEANLIVFLTYPQYE